MGYTTDFIGHVEIHPPLNHDEQQYLSAFQASRRFERDGGGYEVPRNPAAENADPRTVPVDRHNAVAAGQPSLWCGWVPALDGSCLSYDGHEKFYRATEWMRYLIAHFLAPGAGASRSSASWFGGFTFDHVARGIVAGCRRDTHDLYLIEVEENVVTERPLWPVPGSGSGQALTGLLPYEKYLDDWDADHAYH